MSKYKEDIVRLRKQGKTYDEIEEELGCSRGIISYHCNNEGVDEIGVEASRNELSDEKKKEIKTVYKDHTKYETAEICDVSTSSVIKYGESKQGGRTEKEIREQRRERKQNLREEQKRKSVEYLGGKCEKCGYDNSLVALQFHHEEDKQFEISSRLGGITWENLKQELDKCILLCANCHIELHNT